LGRALSPESRQDDNAYEFDLTGSFVNIPMPQVNKDGYEILNNSDSITLPPTPCTSTRLVFPDPQVIVDEDALLIYFDFVQYTITRPKNGSLVYNVLPL
jgi:hypothetical protein